MDLCRVLSTSQTVGAMKLAVDGSIVGSNDHAAELFELDRIALIGRNIANLTAPEDRLATYHRLEAVRNGKVAHSRTTKPCVTANGRRFTASCEFWVLTDGNVPESIELLLYQLPNGKQDAEIWDLKQRFETLQQIVMAALHRDKGISINTVTGGQNQIGENQGGI